MSLVGHVPSRDAELDMHVCAGWANQPEGCVVACGLWVVVLG
jgi:hypothetical protein